MAFDGSPLKKQFQTQESLYLVGMKKIHYLTNYEEKIEELYKQYFWQLYKHTHTHIHKTHTHS